MRRLLVKMSQEELASALGITFQQVQKYEKGSNRIGASRLFEMAQILGVSIQFFFDGLGGTEPSRPNEAASSADVEVGGDLAEFMNSREAVALNRAFMDIECSKLRRTILTLVRSLGDVTDSSGET